MKKFSVKISGEFEIELPDDWEERNVIEWVHDLGPKGMYVYKTMEKLKTIEKEAKEQDEKMKTLHEVAKSIHDRQIYFLNKMIEATRVEVTRVEVTTL